MASSVNPARYSGEVVWVPLVEATLHLWTVALSGLQICRGSSCEELKGCSKDDPCLALIDSGTSLLAGPTPAVERVAEMLQVEPDCSNRLDLGEMHFSFGGVAERISLSSETYVVQESGLEGGFCASSWMPMDTTESRLFILGDVLMREYYTIFDYDSRRIGFARAVHSQPAPAMLARRSLLDSRRFLSPVAIR
mmetsp:Transcript_99387/g.228256  ORF Transcript_99387/g.228256 Transcript_99387/m.228256 type:complete len:194 (+) Transcript_99387:491-1072(+)